MSSYKLKILLLGDGAVGKTSAVQRFVHSYFAASYKLTVGVDILTKDVQTHPDCIATLSIWDIGGQQRFSFIRSTFYKGTAGVIAVFDITRYHTFNPGVINWINEVRQFAGDVPIILLGNKNDLEDLREVSNEEAQNLANQVPCLYFETSAKTGTNIDEAFTRLAREVVERHETDYVRKSVPQIKLENGDINKISKTPTIPAQLPTLDLSESLENGFKMTAEVQSLIKKKIELVLTSHPSKDEGFRFLVLGNEAVQKPLISRLLRAEDVVWPPEDLNILYNTTAYSTSFGSKDYNFQIFFLSNLKQLVAQEGLFHEACRRSDGLIIFYDPTNEMEFKATMQTSISIRELQPDLEIIITPGNQPSPSPYEELEHLEESYKINYHEDLDTIISTLLINTLKRKEKIDRKKRFLSDELKRMQAKLTEVDNPDPVIREMKAIIEKIEGKKAVVPKEAPLRPEKTEKLEKAANNLVFISYSTRDSDLFRIPEVVKLLESYPEIDNALYWEEDSGINIIDYMNENIPKSKVFILFCSENSMNSQSVKAEWQTAFQLKQEGRLSMIPVYIDPEHIPALLKPLLRIYFDTNNLENFVNNLYKEIKKEF